MGTVILKSISRLGCYEVSGVEKDDKRREKLNASGDFKVYAELSQLGLAYLYILAVKPQDIPGVARQLKNKLEKSKEKKIVVISIAAGVKAEIIKNIIGGNCPVIRVMPNTPALVSAGLTAIQKDAGAAREDYELTKKIFSGMGDVIFINGDKFDEVTALSGSGPAYFFYMAEIMKEYAEDKGFSDRDAALIAAKTIEGAGRLIYKEYRKPNKSFSELRRDVTSSGGTTEAALNNIYKEDFKGIFKRALVAAARRSKEISKGEKI